jgi:hypothetical protein
VSTSILDAYADASGKASTEGEKILTVNGCLSTPNKWLEFDNEWQAYLKAAGFRPYKETGRYVFHTAPFWAGRCRWMPSNLSESDKNTIFRDLLGVISRHTLLRFGYGVVLADFYKAEKIYPYLREGLFGEPGAFLSRQCFRDNSGWAAQNGYARAVNYVFDRGDEFWGDLYGGYRYNLKKRPSALVGRLSDGNTADDSPIQAADIIAWMSREYFSSLRPRHLSGLASRVALPTPRPETFIVHKPGESQVKLLTLQHLKAEVADRMMRYVRKIGRPEDVLGLGKQFSNLNDFTSAFFEYVKERDDDERAEQLESWRERGRKKAEQAGGRVTKEQMDKIKMHKCGEDS